MSMLRLQKRLASSVLPCGKKKVDPNETNEIANANSRKQIQKGEMMMMTLMMVVVMLMMMMDDGGGGGDGGDDDDVDDDAN
ncbi:60S ribosomal protein L19 [Microtus ochrogaster]|uniref:Large ribosomal subunit protein eL19 n=1 Tax=Microtus ochrogaster TaxID=79684 RepID=A0A8J6GD26_MICOH|nr:60S ribosomal protein L19 [Microtus ochrogaster]